MRLKVYGILFALLALPSISNAENSGFISIHSGFITGNTFRALNQGSKKLYVTGLVDGILLAPLYGAPKTRLDNFEQCTTGMTGAQVVAIFEKYLNNNPERWHNNMHVIAFSAMREACAK